MVTYLLTWTPRSTLVESDSWQRVPLLVPADSIYQERESNVLICASSDLRYKYPLQCHLMSPYRLRAVWRVLLVQLRQSTCGSSFTQCRSSSLPPKTSTQSILVSIFTTIRPLVLMCCIEKLTRVAQHMCYNRAVPGTSLPIVLGARPCLWLRQSVSCSNPSSASKVVSKVSTLSTSTTSWVFWWAFTGGRLPLRSFRASSTQGCSELAGATQSLQKPKLTLISAGALRTTCAPS